MYSARSLCPLPGREVLQLPIGLHSQSQFSHSRCADALDGHPQHAFASSMYSARSLSCLGGRSGSGTERTQLKRSHSSQRSGWRPRSTQIKTKRYRRQSHASHCIGITAPQCVCVVCGAVFTAERLALCSVHCVSVVRRCPSLTRLL